MSTNANADGYLTRDAILKLLSDDEVARVSMREAGPPLLEGDEYVDLEHPYEGVRRMKATTRITMGEVLPRSMVEDATWSRVCARLVLPQAAR